MGAGQSAQRGTEQEPVTRRQLLKGAGLGALSLAAGVAGGGTLWARADEGADNKARARWPGRVIEVSKPGSIVGSKPVAAAVGEMLEAGLLRLTGEADLTEAWRLFVGPEDVVGIKVDCSGGPQCSTSKELVGEVIRGLKNAGVPDNEIIVFDRFADDLRRAGYRYNTGSQGVRCFASEGGESPAGYDEAVGYQAPVGDRQRSPASNIVSKMVTRLVNLPVLKDDGAVGIAGALRNVAFGCFSNTDRFLALAGDPAIADIWRLPVIQGKVVLNVMDALRAQFDRGPLADPDFCWNPASLYLATDPVALDTIGLWVIEQKRVTEDLSPIAGSNRPPTHLATAASRGLGVGEWGKIDLVTVDLPAVGR